MKKIAKLIVGLGFAFAVSTPAFAENMWCQIKHKVCEEQNSTNSVCLTAYQNCPYPG